MTTLQDVLGDYTPLSNNVVKELKLVKGALACKIFYTSGLKDRVCRMGLTRIADNLGIDRAAASRNINWLVNNDYIDRVQEATHTTPAHYRMTQKFYDLASGQLEGVDIINRGVDNVNRGVDNINQEEELEEELEHPTTTATSSIILEMYRENVNPMPSRIEIDAIDDMEQTYPHEWITYAIEVAVKARRATVNYIEGILKRIKEQGGVLEYVPNKNASKKAGRRNDQPKGNDTSQQTSGEGGTTSQLVAAFTARARTGGATV